MATAEKVQRIPLSLITASPDNTRKTINPAALQELADSLKSVGQLQPIIVRPHPTLTGFEAVFGHRRLRAAELAGWTEIDAIVRAISNREADVARLHENLVREGVHYIEEAEALQRLIDEHQQTAEDIASATGKGLTWVYSRLKLARLHPSVREQLIAHPDWSPETLTLVARVATSLQPQALAKITNGHGEATTLMSYRTARETLRAGYTLQIAAAPWAGHAELAAACQACPRASHNDPAFADADPGLCTDPGCWDTKRKDYTAQRVDELRTDGRVIDGTAGGAPGILSERDYVSGPGGQWIQVDDLVAQAKEAGLDIPQHAVVSGDDAKVGLTEDDAKQLSDALAKHHGMPTAAEAAATRSTARDSDDDTYQHPMAQALAALQPDQRAVADGTAWKAVSQAIEAAIVQQPRQAVDLHVMLAVALEFSGEPEWVASALRAAGAEDLRTADDIEADTATDDDTARRMIEAASPDQQATALVLLAVRDIGGPAWLHGQREIDMPAVDLRLSLARAYGVDPAAVVAAAAAAEGGDQADPQASLLDDDPADSDSDSTTAGASADTDTDTQHTEA